MWAGAFFTSQASQGIPCVWDDWFSPSVEAQSVLEQVCLVLQAQIMVDLHISGMALCVS